MIRANHAQRFEPTTKRADDRELVRDSRGSWTLYIHGQTNREKPRHG